MLGVPPDKGEEPAPRDGAGRPLAERGKVPSTSEGGVRRAKGASLSRAC